MVILGFILMTILIGVDIFVHVVIQLYFEGHPLFADEVQEPTNMSKRNRKKERAIARFMASLTARRPGVYFNPIHDNRLRNTPQPLTESERMQEELEPIFHPHPTEHDESDDLEMVK